LISKEFERRIHLCRVFFCRIFCLEKRAFWIWVLRFDFCLFCFFCREFLWVWFFWFDCQSFRRKSIRDKKFFFEFVCFLVDNRVVENIEFRKKSLREKKKKFDFLKKNSTLKTTLRFFVRRITRDFCLKSSLVSSFKRKKRSKSFLVQIVLSVVFQIKNSIDLISSRLILSLIVFISKKLKSCFFFSFSSNIVFSRRTSSQKKVIWISFKIARSSRRLKKLSQLKKSKKIVYVNRSKKFQSFRNSFIDWC
jgi:hypothetical protein